MRPRAPFEPATCDGDYSVKNSKLAIVRATAVVVGFLALLSSVQAAVYRGTFDPPGRLQLRRHVRSRDSGCLPRGRRRDSLPPGRVRLVAGAGFDGVECPCHGALRLRQHVHPGGQPIADQLSRFGRRGCRDQAPASSSSDREAVTTSFSSSSRRRPPALGCTPGRRAASPREAVLVPTACSR